MSSVKKIEFKLGFWTDVNKQPTIHVGVNGTIDVYMKDGRVIKDLEVGWDDCPGLEVYEGIAYSGDCFNPDKRKVDLTDEEVEEIRELLDDYDKGLWRPVVKASRKIMEMKVSGTLGEEEGYDDELSDVKVEIKEQK